MLLLGEFFKKKNKKKKWVKITHKSYSLEKYVERRKFVCYKKIKKNKWEEDIIRYFYFPPYIFRQKKYYQERGMSKSMEFHEHKEVCVHWKQFSTDRNKNLVSFKYLIEDVIKMFWISSSP